MFSVPFRGEVVSAVGVPPVSEPPSGICTVRRGPLGRAPPAAPILTLFDREGGVKVVSGIVGMEPVDFSFVFARWGTGGDVVALDRETDATSTDCERLAALAAAAAAPDSVFGSSRANDAKC